MNFDLLPIQNLSETILTEAHRPKDEFTYFEQISNLSLSHFLSCLGSNEFLILVGRKMSSKNKFRRSLVLESPASQHNYRGAWMSAMDVEEDHIDVVVKISKSVEKLKNPQIWYCSPY